MGINGTVMANITNPSVIDLEASFAASFFYGQTKVMLRTSPVFLALIPRLDIQLGSSRRTVSNYRVIFYLMPFS